MGTQALRLLAELYRERLDSLILECEHPDEAPDRAAAERRIAFYLRAGARQTALESRVFGVRYRILALPCGGCAADEALGRDLRELYRLMVPGALLPGPCDILRPRRAYYPLRGAWNI